MRQLIVVNRRSDWPLEIEGATVVPAREYLARPDWSDLRSARVYNLCRSYRYQSTGYYVSLLAAARGHRPLPSVATMQDLKSPQVIQLELGEMARLVERLFAPLQSVEFVLSIYFGRNLAKRYDVLSRNLFHLFPAPFLRAEFHRIEGHWRLRRLRTMAFSEIPPNHHEFAGDAARLYFSGKRPRSSQRTRSRYDLAILANPAEKQPPSNEKALARFQRAGEDQGFYVERIGPDEIGRLAEFDALFIRETTAVNHHTFRFARKAAAEGLVVIDDPASILKCTNKVYLAELLQRHGIVAPRTMLVHRGNAHLVGEQLGLPVVLKKPDSAFSVGVIKVRGEAELRTEVSAMLKDSELIVAQEYLPTDFDWRVGLIDGRPLYVCRYHMARGHWQIIRRDDTGADEGNVDTLAVEDAPDAVVQTAVRAAGLIGHGLYGVDLKEVDGRIMVIEVNDNPSIDAGCEDAVLKNALYREIMGVILRRVEERKRR